MDGDDKNVVLKNLSLGLTRLPKTKLDIYATRDVTIGVPIFTLLDFRGHFSRTGELVTDPLPM